MAMDGASTVESLDVVRALAADYCHAIHEGDGPALERILHPLFQMHFPVGGEMQIMDKPHFVARLSGRGPLEGTPSFEILSVDGDANEIARVALWVDLGPRRFTDFLGFQRVGGGWQLISKLTRVARGPALDS